jgi:hypothetical protein
MTGTALLSLLALLAAPAAPCERLARAADLALGVELPEGWCVEPIDASANGAAAAWRLTAYGALETIRPPENAHDRGVLWLHTEASMLAAEERCRRETGMPYSDGCAEGWLFERKDLIDERALFFELAGASACRAASEDREIGSFECLRFRALDGREWLVDPPPGKSNSVLPVELATHVGERRIALLLWLRLAEHDPADDRALAAARAARWRAIAPELARIRVRSF